KQVKISIDTFDSKEFQEVTKFRQVDGAQRVVDSILMVKHDDVELVVNAVVMKRTLEGLAALIDFVRRNRLRLHLLDFTYTDACRTTWEKEFVPNEQVMEILEKLFGARGWVPRFGASYWEFYAPEGAVIRARGSLSGSMRGRRCVSCPRYCQSG